MKFDDKMFKFYLKKEGDNYKFSFLYDLVEVNSEAIYDY